jgi:hypothetical protein
MPQDLRNLIVAQGEITAIVGGKVRESRLVICERLHEIALHPQGIRCVGCGVHERAEFSSGRINRPDLH